MFRGVLNSISRVFSAGSGEQNASVNAISSKCRGGAKDNGSDYDNGRETAGLYWSGPVFVDPDHELIYVTANCCGTVLSQILSYLVSKVTSKQGKTIHKGDTCSLDETANASQSTLKDEGYQSTLDCTTSKNMEDKLIKMEGSYKQRITAMELELKLYQNLTEKYRNEQTDDDDEGFTGKGKGGKGYIQKVCNLEEDLKEQYLSKIKSEKKRLKFQQLDHEMQLMISKIDVFRGFGSGNDFFNKLFEVFEGKSMEVEHLKNKAKEIEGDHVNVLNELVCQYKKIVEGKDLEINDLKELQAGMMRKTRGGWLSELRRIMSRTKDGKKDLKTEELDDKSQLTIANTEALRESDDRINNKGLNKKNKV